METFNMFNIVETLRNYFTRKLLPYISAVKWHFTSR